MYLLIFAFALLGIPPTILLYGALTGKNTRCYWLGWHVPSNRRGFDGCSMTSTCDRCGANILMDSQGNWFSVSDSILED